MAVVDQGTLKPDVEYQFHFFGEPFPTEWQGKTFWRMPVFLTDIASGNDVHTSVGMMAARMIREVMDRLPSDAPKVLVKTGFGPHVQYAVYNAEVE